MDISNIVPYQFKQDVFRRKVKDMIFSQVQHVFWPDGVSDGVGDKEMITPLTIGSANVEQEFKSLFVTYHIAVLEVFLGERQLASYVA